MLLKGILCADFSAIMLRKSIRGSLQASREDWAKLKQAIFYIMEHKSVHEQLKSEASATHQSNDDKELIEAYLDAVDAYREDPSPEKWQVVEDLHKQIGRPIMPRGIANREPVRWNREEHGEGIYESELPDSYY